MTIAKGNFGTHERQQVDLYTIRNANGLTARLITFGARLVGLDAPDKSGRFADITLGFDDLKSYVETDHYFGASCGRYGNRIARGKFELDGQPFSVTCNEANNHLHGGRKGFDKYIWGAYPNETENAITFTHVSPDGDEGFPGELVIAVEYTLTEDNKLIIEMMAMTSKVTILNMVNHAYWNMAGQASGPIHDQMLEIDADFYTPPGEQLLITGEVFKVAGTPFDFRVAKPIGKDLAAVQNAGVAHLSGGGYDHNWVIRGFGPGLRPVASLWDPQSGRGLRLRSTEPGVHVYTGGYINEKMIGKGNHPYPAYSGLTFETQKFPGSPNFAHFPSTRLSPNEIYRHVMEYSFFA
jgi:aldose 1-epimerase